MTTLTQKAKTVVGGNLWRPTQRNLPHPPSQSCTGFVIAIQALGVSRKFSRFCKLRLIGIISFSKHFDRLGWWHQLTNWDRMHTLNSGDNPLHNSSMLQTIFVTDFERLVLKFFSGVILRVCLRFDKLNNREKQWIWISPELRVPSSAQPAALNDSTTDNYRDASQPLPLWKTTWPGR